jgi:putative phosphoribosyl transferase
VTARGGGETAEQGVTVPARGAELSGDLAIPPGARGIVLFAHGSGSSRHSPRNRAVAAALRDAGLGTLLMDLLTPDEERRDRMTGELRFDVGLLGERVVAAVDWVAAEAATAALAVGCFGASTGAAGALIAAAERPERVGTVVSRGGRPDLAAPWLERVEAPTLLIVGERDESVIELNRRALALMRCEAELVIVPGATHLFEEPGALEEVARLAAGWFNARLDGSAREGV